MADLTDEAETALLLLGKSLMNNQLSATKLQVCQEKPIDSLKTFLIGVRLWIKPQWVIAFSMYFRHQFL